SVQTLSTSVSIELHIYVLYKENPMFASYFASFSQKNKRDLRRHANHVYFISLYYFLIVVTTPEPTVRPPSRIEKRVPSSIAIGEISSTSISMLSPGITISTPSGRFTTPVTSVVRK